MTKPRLDRIKGMDDGMVEVHYASVGIQTEATLCNQMHFDNESSGEDTEDPVTCQECISIVQSIQRAKREY